MERAYSGFVLHKCVTYLLTYSPVTLTWRILTPSEFCRPLSLLNSLYQVSLTIHLRLPKASMQHIWNSITLISKFLIMIIITKLVPCGTDSRLKLLSGFQALVTLTLTLDRVTRHTVVHHSSTSIFVPNFTEIGKTLWTDVRTY